jgi:phage I-like protein
MKELLTKIFQMIGLDVPEPMSLAKSIGTITARLNELAREEPTDETLTPSLAEAAGLPAGATVDDLVAWVDETRAQIAAKGEELAAVQVIDCIKAGLDDGKIDLRDAVFLFKSATRTGYRNSLGAIDKFINDEKLIAKRRLPPKGQKPVSSIDKEQMEMNQKIGVSEETFRRYYH